MWTRQGSRLQGNPVVGRPQDCEIYLQESCQILTVNNGEKNPSYFKQREGKGTLWKLARALGSRTSTWPLGQ